MTGCTYDLAYAGPCGAPVVIEDSPDRCVNHLKEVCCTPDCDNRATHQCSEAVSLVCGYPLCDLCQHARGGATGPFSGLPMGPHRRKNP